MDIDDIVSKIVISFMIVILLIFFMLEMSFVFWKAWGWFMPLLIPGIVKITYGQSIITIIMVGILTGTSYGTYDIGTEKNIYDTFTNILVKLATPAIIFFFIWLIKSFII